MNAFEYSDKLWEIFAGDVQLAALLGLDTSDEASYVTKFRQEDLMPEEFRTDSLPFIAFYFADANYTANDSVNKGLLRIDIYADVRNVVPSIRDRIVKLMHWNFKGHNERLRAEGQRTSGIVNVYKYRLEFTPLIST